MAFKLWFRSQGETFKSVLIPLKHTRVKVSKPCPSRNLKVC